VAVCLLRLFFKRAPKIISYSLWIVVGLRLIMPFAFEATFGLIPAGLQNVFSGVTSTIQAESSVTQNDGASAVRSGDINFSETSHGVYPSGSFVYQDTYSPTSNNAGAYGDGTSEYTVESLLPGLSLSDLSLLVNIGAYIWLAGVFAMLCYGIVSYLMFKRKLKTAVCIDGNIFESEKIKSPFVLGIIRPKIFLPTYLSSDEYDYIIIHEQTHISRKDYLIKFAAYFILSLHWFNPLVWLAFLLMGADMEMSCDEKVLSKMGSDVKAGYSRSLVAFASKRRLVGTIPLAFGEGGIKQRVKNVLNFKKHSVFYVGAVAIIAVIVSAGLMMNSTAFDTVVGESPSDDDYMFHGVDIYSQDLSEAYTDIGTAIYEAGLVASARFLDTTDLTREQLDMSMGEGALVTFYMEHGVQRMDGIQREVIANIPEIPLFEGWHLSSTERHDWYDYIDGEGLRSTLVIDIVGLDPPQAWSNSHIEALREQASLIFEDEQFSELTDLSFNVRHISRSNLDSNAAILTDANMRVRRDNAEGEWLYLRTNSENVRWWGHHTIEGRPLFVWTPPGYESQDVGEVIKSLPLPFHMWDISGFRVGDTFVDYHPHVYSITIIYQTAESLDQRIMRAAQPVIAENTFMLFNHFRDLNFITVIVESSSDNHIFYTDSRSRFGFIFD